MVYSGLRFPAPCNAVVVFKLMPLRASQDTGGFRPICGAVGQASLDLPEGLVRHQFFVAVWIGDYNLAVLRWDQFFQSFLDVPDENGLKPCVCDYSITTDGVVSAEIRLLNVVFFAIDVIYSVETVDDRFHEGNVFLKHFCR